MPASFGVAMYDSCHKGLLEGIATGRFDSLAFSESLTSEQAVAPRRSGIYALGNIGDRATVTRIRANRLDGNRELERAYYHACGEILWPWDLANNR